MGRTASSIHPPGELFGLSRGGPVLGGPPCSSWGSKNSPQLQLRREAVRIFARQRYDYAEVKIKGLKLRLGEEPQFSRRRKLVFPKGFGQHPNLLSTPQVVTSPFWKQPITASKAAREF